MRHESVMHQTPTPCFSVRCALTSVTLGLCDSLSLSVCPLSLYLSLARARAVCVYVCRRNNVRGIPTLVVLGRNGQIVTADGRTDVINMGTAAFDSWALDS